MGSIDTVFPVMLIDSVANITNMCGILIVIIISDPYMIGVVFTIIVLYVLILKLYLRASQDLKRLQGICECCNNERICLKYFPIISMFWWNVWGRSPVLSHLTATIYGLITIRTGNIEQKLCHEFDELQNVHSSVFRLTLSSSATFGFYMDIISTLFVACVSYSFVFFYKSMRTSFISWHLRNRNIFKFLNSFRCI